MISSRYLMATCVGLCAIQPARAEAPSPSVDVTAYRDKLVVLGDGKGHFVAVTPMPADERALFYGDGKTFYQVRLVGMSRNGDKWEHAFAEPRLTEGAREEGSGYVGFDGQSYRVECGKRTTVVTAVAAAEAFVPTQKNRPARRVDQALVCAVIHRQGTSGDRKISHAQARSERADNVFSLSTRAPSARCT